MSFFNPDSEHLIINYFEQEEWDKARIVLTQELEHDPNNVWLLTRLSTTYYEERNYLKAKKIAGKALRIKPSDPLVLWDYAGALDMLGEKEKAIKIWNQIISFGSERIGVIETGEGIDWANSLIADCYYRLADAQLALKNKEDSFENFHKHLDMRNEGVDSIYPIELVKEKINSLT